MNRSIKNLPNYYVNIFILSVVKVRYKVKKEASKVQSADHQVVHAFRGVDNPQVVWY